jgi:hypothetical protein
LSITVIDPDADIGPADGQTSMPSRNLTVGSSASSCSTIAPARKSYGSCTGRSCRRSPPRSPG